MGGAFIVVGGLLLCLFSKASIHLFINRYHSSFGDIFFTHATLLGDGNSASLVVIILLFVNFRCGCEIYSCYCNNVTTDIISLFRQ
jgi:hypothetical protein